MSDPLTREEYADALADLDDTIEAVDTTVCDSSVEGPERIEFAVLALTEAVLAVAKGVRLLAEPPPVETREGGFAVIDRDDEVGA